MADNILTTDRAAAPIDIAAKDIAGVLVPRNILTTPAGADISPLTDAELRNSPVAVSTGGLTDAELRAAAVPVSGPVTDIELRAAPVPVSGTVGVSGTVPVSAASLPLPADAATQTTLAAIQTALGSPMQASGGSVAITGTVPVSGTFWQATQPVSIASWGGLTDAQLRAVPVPVSGTITVSNTLTDTELRASAVPVSAASLPLPTGAASEATLDARTGSLTETAPATDTASAGINGRLQRIAQRITSLIALLPASLGPKAGASSLSVVEATPTTVTIVSLQTNATGTTYNAFASQACEQLDIVNTAPSAVDLEVRRGGSGNTIIVPAGSSRMFVGITNASDLQVRRLDQNNTQVTITAEAIKQ